MTPLQQRSDPFDGRLPDLLTDGSYRLDLLTVTVPIKSLFHYSGMAAPEKDCKRVQL